MNIGRSLVFAFVAPSGPKKLLLGGLFSLLFFLVYFPFVVMGYLMRILCDTLEGRDAKLPEWSDHKELFHEGLQPILVVLIYVGPAVLLNIFKSFIWIWTGSNWFLEAVFFVFWLAYFLISTTLLPLPLIRLVVKSSFSEAFDFNQLIAFIKANPGNYFTAWGVWLALGAAAGLIGSLLAGIGIFFTGFVANVIGVHLFAQAYRASSPFADDADGEVRSSLALPPPLNR